MVTPNNLRRLDGSRFVRAGARTVERQRQRGLRSTGCYRVAVHGCNLRLGDEMPDRMQPVQTAGPAAIAVPLTIANAID